MVEAQAVDRVHRIGQTRPVTITKYIVSNTVETVSTPYSRKKISFAFTVCYYKYTPLTRCQYIQWVQKDKLRLIAQSIDFAASATEIETRRMDVSFLPYKCPAWAKC